MDWRCQAGAVGGGRPSIRTLALAGAIAPVLFAVVVTLLTLVEYEFARSLGWDPIRRTDAGWPSVLALADSGWLLVATLASCGVLGVAFALGLYRATRGAAWTALGTGLLGLLSVAVALEAFRTDPPASVAPATWQGDVHDTVYPVVVACALAAPAVLARALWNEPGWRAYGRYSLATAAILLATLVLQTRSAYAQLVEYAFFGSLLLWLELLALRLWSLSRRRPRAGE